ncbi:MAG: hypothetical protein VYD19_00020 [Myxococcota bacterium]|nr:hypothetical protein [Myxococcota bacterium]
MKHDIIAPARWSRPLITLLTALLLSSAFIEEGAANLPAAYLACEGAEPGSPCTLTGPQYGPCTRDTLCEDPPETPVNECVLCVDDCWSREEGVPCLRRWTGEAGRCVAQEACTDKVETSFQECNRCVTTDGEPDQGTPSLGLSRGRKGPQREGEGCRYGTERSVPLWLCLIALFTFFSGRRYSRS